MRILGICGSLRQGSYNRRLLRAAGSLLGPGVELVEWDGLKAIPPFDEDDEAAPPPAVREMRRAITASGALLIATPEYSSSLPGQLKNALDWASRPSASSVLRGKPAAVIGASPSMFGAVWAQAEVRKVLTAAGARVIEAELAVAGAPDQLTADGRLRDPELTERLAHILGELVAGAQPRVEAHAA